MSNSEKLSRAVAGGEDPIAYNLKTSTGVVDVSAASAPSAGQVLTATSSTTATWQSGVTVGKAIAMAMVFGG